MLFHKIRNHISQRHKTGDKIWPIVLFILMNCVLEVSWEYDNISPWTDGLHRLGEGNWQCLCLFSVLTLTIKAHKLYRTELIVPK